MPRGRDIRAGKVFVEIFTRDNQLVRGLRNAQRRLRGFAASVRAVGAKLFGGGTAGAIPLALSAKTFANFESQMARVKALTGASESDFTRLEKAAKRLGATTVFSASQAAEAMSFFALAGFDVDQILASIGPALNLAAAGQIEIAEAADISAKIMAGMGLSASELGDAVDVMAKAMTTANTDLSMLGAAFKFVGPMAKSAGISLEEITAAIQLLSNAGVQGEMAGTTLRGMLLSLTSPSAEASRELSRLGVGITDQSGNVRQLADIIADLENALTGVGSGERLRVLGSIFPARQAAGAAELVSQGAEKLRHATAALGEAPGTASRIARTQLDTLKGDFTILLSSLEGVSIAIGESIGSELRSAVRGVTALLSIFGEWIQQNKKVVLTTAAIVVGVLAVGVSLVGLGLVINLLAFSFGGLATAMTMAGAVLGAILSPIGLVIAGLAALGGYLAYVSGAGGQALAWLSGRFEILKNDAVTAWKAISTALASGDISLAARVLWLTLKMEWKRGTHLLTRLWIQFKEMFLAITTEAIYGTAQLLIDGWSAIEVAWIETTTFLADAWSVFTNMLTKTWHSTVGFIKKAWVRLKSLFDEDVDVDAEIRRINSETTHSIQSAEDQMLQAVGQRDQQRRERRQQIEQDRLATGKSLQDMKAAEHQERQRRHLDDMAESEAELVAARRAWQEAISEVTEPEKASDDRLPSSLKHVETQLAASSEFLADQQRKIESKGGFNVFGLRGLGADSLAQRTARATEQVVVNTKQLVDKAKQGKLVFTP